MGFSVRLCTWDSVSDSVHEIVSLPDPPALPLLVQQSQYNVTVNVSEQDNVHLLPPPLIVLLRSNTPPTSA
ncbi:hypothetical protein XELAEV_18001822mg [Xenopus laevis]|nr:hypothetical protein XELAEV_18001822mg [Xenopus laevis]